MIRTVLETDERGEPTMIAYHKTEQEREETRRLRRAQDEAAEMVGRLLGG